MATVYVKWFKTIRYTSEFVCVCSEQNVGIERRASVCCVLFGVTIVYVASVIIHLGPTIIGGYFDYNELIGNCIFVYGTVESYVVHSMWIAVMTVVMASAVYYISLFHRHLQASATHRIASLLRAVFLRHRSSSTDDVIARAATARSVRYSLSRSRALILMTSLFIVCWYPLFTLTLVDPKFERSAKLYKVLTLVAWSNAALNPFVLLLFDLNVGCARSKRGRVTGSRGQWAESPRRRQSIYERVGSRLYNEGQSVEGTVRADGQLSRDSSEQHLAQHQQAGTSEPWSRM